MSTRAYFLAIDRLLCMVTRAAWEKSLLSLSPYVLQKTGTWRRTCHEKAASGISYFSINPPLYTKLPLLLMFRSKRNSPWPHLSNVAFFTKQDSLPSASLTQQQHHRPNTPPPPSQPPRTSPPRSKSNALAASRPIPGKSAWHH